MHVPIIELPQSIMPRFFVMSLSKSWLKEVSFSFGCFVFESLLGYSCQTQDREFLKNVSDGAIPSLGSWTWERSSMPPSFQLEFDERVDTFVEFCKQRELGHCHNHDFHEYCRQHGKDHLVPRPLPEPTVVCRKSHYIRIWWYFENWQNSADAVVSKTLQSTVNKMDHTIVHYNWNGNEGDLCFDAFLLYLKDNK